MEVAVSWSLLAIDCVLDYSRQAALVERCRQLQEKVEALEPSRSNPVLVSERDLVLEKLHEQILLSENCLDQV